REDEDQRVAERAARREGDDETDVEARLGAVVPRADLPEEPALAALPVDPIAPKDIAAPPIQGDRAHPPPDTRAQERFERAEVPEVCVVEDDAAPSRPAANARPKRPA